MKNLNPVMKWFRASTLTILSLTLSSSLWAQSTIYTLNGTNVLDSFGTAVAGVGDVDGDGHGDFLVGARNADPSGKIDAGRATLYSGRNGGALLSLSGDSAGDKFGWSVAGVGDVNHDNIPDFAVGAPGDDNTGLSSGSVRVFSGANGAVLTTLNGPAAGAWFGKSLDAAGDTNNDGYDDLIVGAPYASAGPGKMGTAVVISGYNWVTLRIFSAQSGIDLFGDAVAGAGDVNNDNFDDLFIGAPEFSLSASETGRAYLYSGKTGALIRTHDGQQQAGTNFANSVDGCDLNGDGRPDLIVGEVFGDPGAGLGNAGRIYAFNGVTGALMYTIAGVAGSDNLGYSVACAGDVDGDGKNDIIGGAPYNDTQAPNGGRAAIYSGPTGALLYTFHSAQTDAMLGGAVQSAGDVNGDGIADVIAGAISINNSTGQAQVLTSCKGTITTYGSGCLCSGGFVAELSVLGCASPGKPVRFVLTEAYGGSQSKIQFSSAQANTNLPGGCKNLVSQPPIRQLGMPALSQGKSVRGITLMPGTPPGTTYFEQVYVTDPGLASGICTTNAVKMVIR